MKVFVWHRHDFVSRNYHQEGGVVVFADSLERAIDLARREGAFFDKYEGEVPAGEPDEVREVEDGNELVYIMPDAGCC